MPEVHQPGSQEPATEISKAPIFQEGKISSEGPAGNKRPGIGESKQ
jgi:hypothetical protein